MSLSVCRWGLVDGCMDGRKYQAHPISFVQTHSRKMPETASEGGGQAQEEREGGGKGIFRELCHPSKIFQIMA